MQYLHHLQLWGENTPFPTYEVLANAMKKHGAPLMELLSIHMRSIGSYVSRQLSFSDVIMEHRHIELTESECKMYDECTEVMRSNSIKGSANQSFFQKLITGIKTRHAINIAKERLQVGDSVVISIVNTGAAFAKRCMKKQENVTNYKRTNYYTIGEDIFEDLNVMVENVPVNPIDAILDEFGHENVAELTGRSICFYKKNGYKVK